MRPRPEAQVTAKAPAVAAVRARQQPALLATRQWITQTVWIHPRAQSFAAVFPPVLAAPSTALELVRLTIGCFDHLPVRSASRTRLQTALSCLARTDSSPGLGTLPLSRCYRSAQRIWGVSRHRLSEPPHTTGRCPSPSSAAGSGCFLPCSSSGEPFVLTYPSHSRLDFVRGLLRVPLATPLLHSASGGSSD